MDAAFAQRDSDVVQVDVFLQFWQGEGAGHAEFEQREVGVGCFGWDWEFGCWVDRFWRSRGDVGCSRGVIGIFRARVALGRVDYSSSSYSASTLSTHADPLPLVHQTTHVFVKRAPFEGLKVKHMLRLVGTLVPHLQAVMDVVTHVIVFIPTLESKSRFPKCTELAETPLLEVAVVEEVDPADTMR